MADGLVSPPSDDNALSAGSSDSSSSGSRKKLIYAAAAIGGLGLIYLYAKSRSKSSSSTTAPPMVIAPASNADTAVSSLATSLQDQLAANNTSFSTGLTQAITKLEGDIAGSQGAIISAIGKSQAAPAPPAGKSLPTLNPNDFPRIVPFGTYQPGQYTQIGVVNNGVYNGAEVTGGAPVYANVFGGFAQGFNMANLPNGTALYIPTSLTPYISGHS